MSCSKKNLHCFKTLIFISIPKTAGSTLHPIFNRHFSRKETYWIQGDNVHRSIENFKQLSMDRRKKIACLGGHMRFGLHEYLPQPCAYVTFLRDPVERIISHYYYVIRTPRHYLYQEVTAQKMSLADYINSGISPELSNDQTSMLAGVYTDLGESPPPNMLETAKANLQKHFLMVGLTESFDESLVLMKKRLAWTDVYYTRVNVTRTRPDRSNISEETIRQIQSNNKLDLELYTFGQRLLTQRVQQAGKLFTYEVKLFRLMNRVYNTVGGNYSRRRLRNLGRKLRVKQGFLIRE